MKDILIAVAFFLNLNTDGGYWLFVLVILWLFLGLSAVAYWQRLYPETADE